MTQPTKKTAAPNRNPQSVEIDAEFGLEPVFEPGRDPRQRPLDSEIEIECPYCWEQYMSSVDLTLGAQSYIEDCQICCHAIAIDIEIGNDGFEAQVSTRRVDG